MVDNRCVPSSASADSSPSVLPVLPGVVAAWRRGQPTCVLSPNRSNISLTMRTLSPPRFRRRLGPLVASVLVIRSVAAPLAAGQAPVVKPLPAARWQSGLPDGVAADVKIVGRYAYVASGPGGLDVIDITDPTRLVRVGGCDLRDAWALAVAGNYAYVTSGFGGLHIIDISDPAHCVRVGGYANRNWFSDVAVSGGYAYVAAQLSGLEVIDVRDPVQPVRVGGTRVSDRGWSVAVSGNYAYVAGGDWSMEVIDVTVPTNCVRVGQLPGGDSIFDVAISGNYVFAAAADDNVGLKVIDVSDPAHPRTVGGCVTGEDASSVTVAGNHAYVHTTRAGLRVIDISEPGYCVPLGEYATSGRVAVADGLIYVAAVEAGLLMLPSLPNVQFAVQVDAAPNLPFTLEATTDLGDPTAWQPLVTTNVPTMPFALVDFDVKVSGKPRKFYRVRSGAFHH